jgi:hypothetical protein
VNNGARRRGAGGKTIAELVKAGKVPKGSLLADALLDNPQLARGEAPRERTPEEQLILVELFSTPSNAFGPRSRERQRLVRLGESIDRRIANFLAEYPGIDLVTFFEIAADRLLRDLGD